MKKEWHDMIHRYIAGTLDKEETLVLQEALKAEPALRALFLDYMNLDAALEVQAATQEATRELLTAPTASRTLAWFSRLPLAAAAAGIVVGVFSAGLLFAYVAPSLGKVVTLLDDGFESGPAPLVTGVPVEPGRWSGDFSEVAGDEQGVKPESGVKMLRLLRADYEGKANAKEGHVADVYRLIDLRPHRQEIADGSAVVQLSAGFNAFEFPGEEIYSNRMTVHAFDAETVAKGTLRTVSAWDEHCLATASTGATRLDRDPATWQRRTIDLRLPANTDFVMIHLMISGGLGSHPQADFAGHYIDDVRLTLRHSPLR